MTDDIFINVTTGDDVTVTLPAMHEYKCPKCGWKTQWVYRLETDDKPFLVCLQCIVHLLREHGVGEMVKK